MDMAAVNTMNAASRPFNNGRPHMQCILMSRLCLAGTAFYLITEAHPKG